ncbi:MAG: exodeoxyribonuclease III [Rhodomicrobium sp.]|nr:MAG: exodeoxyribonuclease III [Rhodomicrobium sp.]
MDLKIATWNINSIRIRLDHLANFSKEHQPDIIALQETKCSNEHFPHQALEEMGFPYRINHGEKAYNGVAILSRIPIETYGNEDFNGSQHTRHQAVEIKHGHTSSKAPLILHNFYIPAGGDVPDRNVNLKFGQKLDYLTNLANWFKDDTNPHSENMILVGDLNIAPLETDVWSHKQLLKVVSHTPIEVEHLKAVQKAGNWHDVMRHFTPEPEPLYTWWSYRAKDWRASNRGRRLDHVWVTPKMADKATSVEVVTKVRDWEKTSDHAPVLTTFKL